MYLVFVKFQVKHDPVFVLATRQILHSSYCPTYDFLCLYFDSVLILCNIFVELEHLIISNNSDKYHRINIKLMVHRQSMYSILS